MTSRPRPPDASLRRLVLWDIDGTLLSAGPVARSAFDGAIHAATGLALGDHGVHMSGKTDPQIALEILAKAAVAEADARGHLPHVLLALEHQFEVAADLIRRDGRVHPGVREALARLGREPGVVQSVLTGNLASTARVKLAAFGLDELLDLEVGAYGSDHEDRVRLVPVALERVRRLRAIAFEPGEVWIVGDTPADLACARAGGARCILVGTGRYGAGELMGLGADLVLADLSGPAAATAILSDVAGTQGRPAG